MLLRSLTKHVKDQNWFAVFLDFFIVVVGILIAFQITNWNEERSNRKAELFAIDRLISEYEQNRKLIAENIIRSEVPMRASLELRSMIAPEPDPNMTDESMAGIFMDVMQNPKLSPNLGSTSALMSSGDLGLIEDADIQMLLSQWSADLEIINDWQEIERMHGEELLLGLTFSYLAWPNLDQHVGGTQMPSSLKSDFVGLFSSKQFEGLLHNRWYNNRASIERMRKLDADTVELLDRLKARKEALQ